MVIPGRMRPPSLRISRSTAPPIDSSRGASNRCAMRRTFGSGKSSPPSAMVNAMADHGIAGA